MEVRRVRRRAAKGTGVSCNRTGSHSNSPRRVGFGSQSESLAAVYLRSAMARIMGLDRPEKDCYLKLGSLLLSSVMAQAVQYGNSTPQWICRCINKVDEPEVTEASHKVTFHSPSSKPVVLDA